MKSVSLLLSLLFFAAQPASAEPVFDGPVFDTHMHYSRDAWQVYSPGEILEFMDRAKVSNALVSSTPDEGTLTLFDFAPQRIIPGFRPYRSKNDRARLHQNSQLLAYSKARLALGQHTVFGEVILHLPENLNTPEMTEYLDIVVEQGLVVHSHSDAAVIEALFNKRPKMKVLWAHAGFSEPVEEVARMLDRHPNLWAELSYRGEDILPVDELDPQWRDLLIRHAGRFTIGSDTWNNDRWLDYAFLIAEHRQWLGELPPEVAARIAYQNAETLLGNAASSP